MTDAVQSRDDMFPLCSAKVQNPVHMSGCSKASCLGVACNTAKVKPCTLMPAPPSLSGFYSLPPQPPLWAGFPDHLAPRKHLPVASGFPPCLLYCPYILFAVWTLSFLSLTYQSFAYGGGGTVIPLRPI